MIRNYGENALLESSGIALFLSHIKSQHIWFYTTLVNLCYVNHTKF